MHPVQPSPPFHRPEVHGHRGCRGLYPENTLPAFLHALAIGVDVLELDVVISQDEQVVVAHDHWLSARLGYGPGDAPLDPHTEQQLRLYDMPYAAIRQCALGVVPHPLFPSQQLVRTYRPLLREVLQATALACQQLGRPPVRYSVELKSTLTGDGKLHPAPARFVELVLAELLLSDVFPHTTLLSFDYRILQAARLAKPALALCFLLEGVLPPLSQLFAPLGFVPEAIGPAYQLVTPELLQYLRQHYPATQLVPWTVNSVADLVAIISLSVDGITTDFPDRLLKLLNQCKVLH